MYSATGLGKIGDRRAIEPLLGLLKDPFLGVREHAVVGLGLMYEPRFAETILAVAKNDPEPMVRQTAAYVLLDRSRDPKVLKEAERYKIDRLPEAGDQLRREFLIIDVSTGLALTLLALLGTRFGPGGQVAACCLVVALGFWMGPQGLAVVTALVSSLVSMALGLVAKAERGTRFRYWWTLAALIACMLFGVVFRGMLYRPSG